MAGVLVFPDDWGWLFCGVASQKVQPSKKDGEKEDFLLATTKRRASCSFPKAAFLLQQNCVVVTQVISGILPPCGL